MGTAIVVAILFDKWIERRLQVIYLVPFYKLTFLQTETSQNGFILTLKGSFVLSNSPWVMAAWRGPMISLSMQTSRVLKSTFPTSFPC